MWVIESGEKKRDSWEREREKEREREREREWKREREKERNGERDNLVRETRFCDEIL